MTFLDALQLSMQTRAKHDIFDHFRKIFTIEACQKLIKLSGSNINFRSIFIELLDLFHVDFKSCLLDGRANYYYNKPIDQ